EQLRRGSDPDPEKVLEVLDQAALAYWLEGPTGPVAVRSPVNDGFRWAAGFHAEREEWQKALDTWRRWTPVTTCKNEWWVMLAERAGNIALCQAWLGGATPRFRSRRSRLPDGAAALTGRPSTIFSASITPGGSTVRRKS
ncbi:MAG TPA: hypothetical protein VKF62_03055, partial [Planctomycetota bacterium]|nr:hypothetical protein [Planctomycetota bacterium]